MFQQHSVISSTIVPLSDNFQVQQNNSNNRREFTCWCRVVSQFECGGQNTSGLHFLCLPLRNSLVRPDYLHHGIKKKQEFNGFTQQNSLNYNLGIQHCLIQVLFIQYLLGFIELKINYMGSKPLYVLFFGLKFACSTGAHFLK